MAFFDNDNHLEVLQDSSLGIGFWSFNIKDRKLSCSPSVGNIFGFSPSHFIPSYEQLREVIDAKDYEKLLSLFNTVTSSPCPVIDSSSFECQITRANGSIGRIEIRYQLEAIDSGEDEPTAKVLPSKLLGMVLDISHRASSAEGNSAGAGMLPAGKEIKERAENTIEIKDQFSNAMRVANVGFFEFSLTKSCIYWSEEHYQIFGVDPNSFNPEPGKIIDFVYKDDVKIYEKAQLELSRGKPIVGLEYRIFIHGSQIRHISLNAEPDFDEMGAYIGCIGSVQDITERKIAQQQIRESEARFRTLYDENPAMFFTLSRGGRILSVNKYGAEQLDYEVHELVNSSYFSLVSDEDVSNVNEFLTQCFSKLDEVAHIEIRNRTASGEIIWVRLSGRVVSRDVKILQLMLVCEDITEIRIMSEKLAYQASHDALTGLINRYEFETRLKDLLIGSGDKNGLGGHALCYLDLDQFKVINDTFGHVAGDELLRQVSKLVKSTCREKDMVARLGGDEFGIVLSDLSLEDAITLVEKVLVEIENFQFVWNGRVFSIGASCGLVEITREEQSLTSLLKQVDVACYAAKEAGGNRLHLYQGNEASISEETGRMHSLNELKAALYDNRLFLFSQSIQPLEPEGKGLSYEILLRVMNSEGEMMRPFSFLAAAERYNYSVNVDRWVVDAYFNWLAKNPAHIDKLERCFINLSGHSLGDDYFLEGILTRFTESNIPPSKICFEITETAAIGNLDRARDFMHSLQSIGVKFALDDFGSGMSSFGYLKNLPVDYLKIDGEFVISIDEDPISMAMLKSIIDIGKVMGKKTIAEFVENVSIFDKLKELNVDYGQGYFLSHPCALNDVLDKKE